MSKCSDFFLFNFFLLLRSPVLFLVTINFGARNWSLAVGRLAETNAGWHSRTTVSVGAMYCALVLCVISFHYLHTIGTLEALHPEAPTVAIFPS